MGAFLGISLWIALATIIPGLVTIATIYGAFATIQPNFFHDYICDIQSLNDWILTAIAITIMVLTQALGILQESFFINRRFFGETNIKVEIPKGIDPHGETEFVLQPYFEYKGLYLLLAELQENEDSQGHLKRALAQFFLTNNTLISYYVGIIITIILMIIAYDIKLVPMGTIYILFLVIFWAVSFKVARIRFVVMAKALWAARRRRQKHKLNNKSHITT